MKRGGPVPSTFRYNGGSPVSVPNQQPTSSIDWDAVDFGKVANMDSMAFHTCNAVGDNVSDEQFHDMSLSAMARRLDRDADSIRRFNNTNATEFGNVTATTTRISAVSLAGVNHSIGEYFKSRSQYPAIGERLDYDAHFAPSGSTIKPPEGPTRESLTSFFMGSKSEGQSSDQMINKVLKYCMGKQRESDAAQVFNAANEERLKNQPESQDESVVVGIMDISAISSIPNSPPHSTPKRASSTSNNNIILGSRLSLRDMRYNRSDIFQRALAADSKPKYADASAATSFADSYRERKINQQERDKEAEVPRGPVKEERNASPNSSISSTATSASATAQCQLQIYASQNPPSVVGIPASHNIPIVIQVQCPCSNRGGNGAINVHGGCSQNSLQPQYIGRTTCNHVHPQQQVMSQMVPMMAMPVMMPVMPQPTSSCCNHQVPVQYQPVQNVQQCQCRCSSAIN